MAAERKRQAAKPVTTVPREAVTNIDQPTAERLSQDTITVGKVKIVCRALTFWERQYADILAQRAAGVVYDEAGKVVDEGDQAAAWIEGTRAQIRLGIDSVEGMPCEWEPLLIGGNKRQVISEATLSLLPDDALTAIASTVQRMTLLSRQEKLKLDFFSQSAAQTGDPVTASDALSAASGASGSAA